MMLNVLKNLFDGNSEAKKKRFNECFISASFYDCRNKQSRKVRLGWGIKTTW